MASPGRGDQPDCSILRWVVEGSRAQATEQRKSTETKGHQLKSKVVRASNGIVSVKDSIFDFILLVNHRLSEPRMMIEPACEIWRGSYNHVSLTASSLMYTKTTTSESLRSQFILDFEGALRYYLI